MIRIDASKLIQTLLSNEKQPNFYFILSDNIIFQNLVVHKVESDFNDRVKLFASKNSIEEYVNYIATCGMFEQPKISCIVLPEKLTQKTWGEIKKILARLPVQVEKSAYFFGPTSLKNTIKESELPKGSFFYLCYEPSEFDLPKCTQLLLLRYASLAKKDKQEQGELVRLALESYSGDLYSCFMHFSRMEQGKLSFTAALAGNPEVNGFHVAEAIALNDKHLIELRLTQCANCGEEASSVFMALVYFLKQVVAVQAAFEVTKNLKLAFEQVRVPFPAQARLQKALSFLNAEKSKKFFMHAAKIEMELRLQKNPHKYLAAELLNWLAN